VRSGAERPGEPRAWIRSRRSDAGDTARSDAYRFALYLSGDPATAEDLTSEASCGTFGGIACSRESSTDRQYRQRRSATGRFTIPRRSTARVRAGMGQSSSRRPKPAAGRGLEVHEVAGQHGGLQASRSALDLIDGILSRQEIVWQDVPERSIGVRMRSRFWCLTRRRRSVCHDESSRAWSRLRIAVTRRSPA
jgi:hypothetical protein